MASSPRPDRGREFQDLAFSPDYANDRTVYVATIRGGLDVSTDGGDHWFGTSMADTYVTTIGVSPDFRNDDLLLVSTAKGLLRSTDRGVTKEGILPSPRWPPIDGFEFSPNFATDNTVYAAAGDAGLLRSTDRGKRWAPVQLGRREVVVRDVAVAPDGSPGLILATWGKGLLYSLDRGESWSQALGSPPLDPFVTSVSMSPNYAQDQRSFATTQQGGLATSEDRGHSWEWVEMGFIPLTVQTDTHWRGVEFSPSYSLDQQIFVNMFEGLRIHRPGFVNPWFSPQFLPTRMGRHVNISPDYPVDNTIVATGYGVELYYSEDRGQTWQIRNQGSNSISNYSLALSPEFGTDGVLLSGTGNGVELSSDRGRSWTPVLFPSVPRVHATRALRVSPGFAVDSTAFSGDHAAIRKTTNGGRSWRSVFDLEQRCQDLSVSPNFAEDQMAMFITTSALGRSTDAGDSWHHFGENLEWPGLRYLDLSPNFAADSVIFVGYRSKGMSRSDDGGRTWKSLNAQLPDLLINDISISGTFAEDHTLAAATHAQGVIISTDAGQSWERRWPDGLEGGYAECLAVSPDYARDSTIVAGSYRGYYMTTNGGRTWEHTTHRDRYDDARSDTALFYPGGAPFRPSGGLHALALPTFKKAAWVTTKNQECAESSLTIGVTVGASIVFPFEGTGVFWIGAHGPNMGRALWSIDGAAPDTIDLWAPESECHVVLHSESGLSRGLHHATIEVLGGPGGEEGWNFGVSLDAFDVEYGHHGSKPDSVRQNATDFGRRARR